MADRVRWPQLPPARTVECPLVDRIGPVVLMARRKRVHASSDGHHFFDDDGNNVDVDVVDYLLDAVGGDRSFNMLSRNPDRAARRYNRGTQSGGGWFGRIASGHADDRPHWFWG